MKAVQNVKDRDHEDRLRYTMDRLIDGRWYRWCVLVAPAEESQRHVIAMRLKRARRDFTVAIAWGRKPGP